jgi:hypothetical protein
VSGLGIWDLKGLGTYRFGIKLISSVVSGFGGFWALCFQDFRGVWAWDLGFGGFGDLQIWY